MKNLWVALTLAELIDRSAAYGPVTAPRFYSASRSFKPADNSRWRAHPFGLLSSEMVGGGRSA
jgi:hypothetical protein